LNIVWIATVYIRRSKFSCPPAAFAKYIFCVLTFLFEIKVAYFKGGGEWKEILPPFQIVVIPTFLESQIIFMFDKNFSKDTDL